jgi:hypothetical protein
VLAEKISEIRLNKGIRFRKAMGGIFLYHINFKIEGIRKTLIEDLIYHIKESVELSDDNNPCILQIGLSHATNEIQDTVAQAVNEKKFRTSLND